MRILTTIELLAIGTLITACQHVPHNKDQHKIPYDPALTLRGAAGIERKADVENSPYFKTIDFYRQQNTKTLTIVPHFKTIQQTTGVTCGPACVLMVLEHLGLRGDYNELDLKKLRGTDQDTTYLRHITNILDQIEGVQYQSTFDYAEVTPATLHETFFLEYLKQGIPVIVGTNAWGGHWQIIIGYDDMGTANTYDDVIVLADPYDTTDHNQDGYIVFPLQLFYYETWINHFDPDYNWGLFVAVRKK
jgi:hypothetical protein